MTTLPNYKHFDGIHYETGCVHNALAYQGLKMPHTKSAPSEALLLGLSGGITFGYFSFAYKGFDPHVALLTRNTFNPFETMLNRLVRFKTSSRRLTRQKPKRISSTRSKADSPRSCGRIECPCRIPRTTVHSDLTCTR